jgi:hypothetical protein
MARRQTWNVKDKNGTDERERKLTKRSWLGTDRQMKIRHFYTPNT